MRFILLGLLCILVVTVSAQRDCKTIPYQQGLQQADPLSVSNIKAAETMIREKLAKAKLNKGGADELAIIQIPVVVHVLYHVSEQNLSDAIILSQIEALNQCFRRQHPDTVNTPARFAELAADCRIEFKLAVSDPGFRATNGIVRRYTPVEIFQGDDAMKFAAQGGDDAWSSGNYLNIWVCNMARTAGYSSLPGSPAEKDGIVLAFNAFGVKGVSGYAYGKTAVHETGHWLGLKHIWGDAYCGDDEVDDTPTQGNFTSSCPNGEVRLSCSNGPNGDMYMNYMDLTLDACTNMFTEGQKLKMRLQFDPGSPRYSILRSMAFTPPRYSEAALPDSIPLFTQPRIFPNPAVNSVTLDLSADIRWIGTSIRITSLQGRVVKTILVNSKIQAIDIANFPTGVYIISGSKKDGSTIKQKFVKL